MTGLLPSPEKRTFPKWNVDNFELGYDSDGEILEPCPSDDEQDDTELPSSTVEDTALTGASGSVRSDLAPGSTNAESNQPPHNQHPARNMSVLGLELTEAGIRVLVVADLLNEMSRRNMSTIIIKKFLNQYNTPLKPIEVCIAYQYG